MLSRSKQNAAGSRTQDATFQQQDHDRSAIYLVDEPSLKQQAASFRSSSKLKHYESPSTKGLEIVDKPPPLHALGEIPLDQDHHRVHPSHAGNISGRIRREHSGRVGRTESWRSRDGASASSVVILDGGQDSAAHSLRSPLDNDAASHSARSDAEHSQLKIARRKSLVKLLSMPTNEISMMGDIDDTINKVKNDEYNLADDVPGSPSFAGSSRNRFGQSQSLGASFGAITNAEFQRLQVGRFRPARATAEQDATYQELPAIDPSMLPDMAEELEQAEQSESGPVAQLEFCLQKSINILNEIDLTVCPREEQTHLHYQRESCAAVVNFSKNLLTVELNSMVERLKERILSLERIIAVERTAAGRKEEELRVLQAHMRSVGMVPTFRGVVAPEGNVCVVQWDVPDAPLIWHDDAQTARAALGVLATVIRQLQIELKGYEGYYAGDCGTVLFEVPKNALDFSLRLQKSLVGASWSETLLKDNRCEQDSKLLFRGLKIRIAVHVGEVETWVDPATQRTEYYGEPVRETAEMLRFAQPGFSVVSEEILQALPQEFPLAKLATTGGGTLIPIGDHRVDGFRVPLNILLPTSLKDRMQRMEGHLGQLQFCMTHPLRPLDIDPTRVTTFSSAERFCIQRREELDAKKAAFNTVTKEVRLEDLAGTSFTEGTHSAAIVAMSIAGLYDAYEKSNVGAATIVTKFYECAKQCISISKGSIIVMKEGSLMAMFPSRSEACSFATAVHTSMVALKWSTLPSQIEAIPDFSEVFVGGTKVFNGPRIRCAISFGDVEVSVRNGADSSDSTPLMISPGERHLVSKDSTGALHSARGSARGSARSNGSRRSSIGKSPRLPLSDGVHVCGNAADVACALSIFALGGETVVTHDSVGSEAIRTAVSHHSELASIGRQRLHTPHLDAELFQLLPRELSDRKAPLHLKRGNIMAADGVQWPPARLGSVARHEHDRVLSAARELEKLVGLLENDAKPSGTVATPTASQCTFVFVEAPLTEKMWRAHGELCLEAMRTFGRVVRMAIMELNDGYEVFSSYDCFFIAFTSTTSAAKFCCTVMEKLCVAYWPQGLSELEETLRVVESDALVYNGLRARMSVMKTPPAKVHVGINANSGRTRFSGHAVRHAAKYAALAAPGEIVMDEDTKNILYTQLQTIGNPVIEPAGSVYLAGESMSTQLYYMVPHSLRYREFSPISVANPIGEWLSIKTDDDQIAYTVTKDSKLATHESPSTRLGLKTPRSNQSSLADKSLPGSSDYTGPSPLQIDTFKEDQYMTHFHNCVQELVEWAQPVLSSSWSAFTAEAQTLLHDRLSLLFTADMNAKNVLTPFTLPDPDSYHAISMSTPTDQNVPVPGALARRASMGGKKLQNARRKTISKLEISDDTLDQGRIKSELSRMHQILRKTAAMYRDYISQATDEKGGHSKGFFTEQDFLVRFVTICKDAGVYPSDDGHAKMNTDKTFAAFMLLTNDSENIDNPRGKVRDVVRSMVGHLAKHHHYLSKTYRKAGTPGGATGGATLPSASRRQSSASESLSRWNSVKRRATLAGGLSQTMKSNNDTPSKSSATGNIGSPTDGISRSFSGRMSQTPSGKSRIHKSQITFVDEGSAPERKNAAGPPSPLSSTQGPTSPTSALVQLNAKPVVSDDDSDSDGDIIPADEETMNTLRSYHAFD